MSTTPDLLPVLALKVRAIRQKFTEILTQKGWSERPLMEADIKVFDLGELDLAVIVRLHLLSNLVKFLGSFSTIKLDQVDLILRRGQVSLKGSVEDCRITELLVLFLERALLARELKLQLPNLSRLLLGLFQEGVNIHSSSCLKLTSC